MVRNPDTSPGDPLTHVFLDGGKARVPLDKRQDFLDEYASQVGLKRHLCVVERTLGTYRMFADLDLRLPIGVDHKEYLDSLIEFVLFRAGHLPEPLLSSSIAIAVRKNQTPEGKTGAHIVFCDVYVDDATAMSLRDYWVDMLSRVKESLEYENERFAKFDFDSIIDAAVYKRSGLRMPYSRKSASSVGGDEYVPRAFIERRRPQDENGKVELPRVDLSRTPRQWLDLLSLRAGLGHPKISFSYSSSSSSNRSKKSKKYTNPCTTPMKTPDDRRTIYLNRTQIRSLSRVLPSPYRSDVVSGNAKYVLLKRTDREPCVVVELKSRYCMNVKREHTSNRSYIVAVPGGRLYQCCFSKRCCGKKALLKSEHSIADFSAL